MIFILQAVLLIFYLNYWLVASESPYCTKTVRVQKTRQVPRTRYTLVTKQRFWGYAKSEYVPSTYWETQYYWMNEVGRSCCIGYKHPPFAINVCLPDCSPECGPNSSCTAPSRCTCHSGYELSADGRCAPLCEPACDEHSYCQLPGKCACAAGYKMGNTSCEPDCAETCPPNSICVAPNACDCELGYQWLVPSELCAPICKAPACGKNSFCVSPNKCACDNGYKDSGNSSSSNVIDCEPVCEAGCPAFSRCVGPEHCECEAGYEMSEDDMECVPLCREPCPAKSVCYKPNECLCEEGYRLRQDPPLVTHCEPICAQSCSYFGKCEAPNQCTCLPGYAQANVSEPLCRPACSGGCMNGLCFAPERCVCNPGYLMGPNNTCTPVCSLGCKHANCVAPEQCDCEAGYVLAPHSVHECEPICEPACEHGYCLLPNVCLCHPGYEPQEKSNLCVPITISTEESTTENTTTVGITTEEDTTEESTTPESSNEESSMEESTVGSRTVVPAEEVDATTSTVDPDTQTRTSLAPVAYMLMSGGQCAAHCLCWVEYDEFGTLSQSKCQRVCLDANDAPCLNLQQCYCNLEQLLLTCNHNALDYESSVETATYTCRVRSTSLTPTTAAASTERPRPAHIDNGAATHSSKNSSAGNLLWLWVLAGVAAFLLLSATVFVVRRFVSNHRQRDELIIMYPSDEAPNYPIQE